MKLIVQRVRSAQVMVEEKRVGRIQKGLLVFIGVTHDDTKEDATYLANKTAGLRIFNDNEEKMNQSVKDTGGACLVVSQFTLYGNCRKGNRPSFTAAAQPEMAQSLIEEYILCLTRLGVPVQQGEFAAKMRVQLENDGPVTFLLESLPSI